MYFCRKEVFWLKPALGYDPQGYPVHRVEDLPETLNLSSVIIGKSGIGLDGWVLPYGYLTKSSLGWLKRNLLARVDAHPEDKPWINELMDTFQERLFGKF